MFKEEKIELFPVEQTAYWWTYRLLKRTRDFALHKENNGHLSKQEEKFLNIFYNYTDKEWRNVYSRLKDFIIEDVNNYVPIKNIIGMDAFNQDTAVGGHNRLNSELAQITGVKGFPDVRLADNSHKDEVIYTSFYGSHVWYKSCSIRPLPDVYDPIYLITGDEKELDMYNQLLSTLISLEEIDKEFNDLNFLREEFCKHYQTNVLPKENIEDVKDLFNKCYSIANEREIVLGWFWKKTFSMYDLEYDKAGLSQKCLCSGEVYANCILSAYKEKTEETPSKDKERTK